MACYEHVRADAAQLVEHFIRNVTGYGTLTIFQMEASPCWYARFTAHECNVLHNTAKANIGKTFPQVATTAGLLRNITPTAELYDLILFMVNTFMRSTDIDSLVLARNARTSVEMIDRFYARPLIGEMKVYMLHSRKKKKKAAEKG